MTGNETLNQGTIANEKFVASMKTEFPDLAEVIPVDCKDCSTAWREVAAGRSDKIQDCSGRTEVLIGEKVVRLCCLQPPDRGQ